MRKLKHLAFMMSTGRESGNSVPTKQRYLEEEMGYVLLNPVGSPPDADCYILGSTARDSEPKKCLKGKTILISLIDRYEAKKKTQSEDVPDRRQSDQSIQKTVLSSRTQ